MFSQNSEFEHVGELMNATVQGSLNETPRKKLEGIFQKESI
jgi:hypothetical protein